MKKNETNIKENTNEKFIEGSYKNLAWEKGKVVFGTYHSGITDLSKNAKAKVKVKIHQSFR